jgi:hypothetical protein
VVEWCRGGSGGDRSHGKRIGTPVRALDVTG